MTTKDYKTTALLGKKYDINLENMMKMEQTAAHVVHYLIKQYNVKLEDGDNILTMSIENAVKLKSHPITRILI